MNRIAELRKAQGINQSELASLVGYAQSTVSNWENETYFPNYETLFKLADIFKVSMDYILGYQEGESPVVKRMLQEYIGKQHKIWLNERDMESIERIVAEFVATIKAHTTK